jgi:putative ABC transport system substrate-binding protein
MRRREFITLFSGVAMLPVTARAQGGRVQRLGALLGGDEGDPDRQAYAAEFRKGLAEHGWIEGRNIQIDWRWAAGNNGRAATYARELVALKPDVLFLRLSKLDLQIGGAVQATGNVWQRRLC